MQNSMKKSIRECYKATPGIVWQLKRRYTVLNRARASRKWYKRLSGELNSLGFNRIQPEAVHCVFYKNVNCHHLIIGVYVDDNLIIPDSPDLVAQTKDLASCFKIYLGEVHWILNMEVTRDCPNRTIRLYTTSRLPLKDMEWPNANQQLPLWR